MPSNWVDVFLEAIAAAEPHLVHIQHGLYLGHGRNLTRFLAGLGARRIPCVVTVHGVWPSNLFRRWPARFYRQLAEKAERVVIHQRAGSLAILERYGIPVERIAVIPHGTGGGAANASPHIREMADTTGRRAVLFAGNIFRRKGLHVVIKAFPAVVRRIPDACLLVVGKERDNNIVDRVYRLWLHALMRRGLSEGWLLRRTEYVSDAELLARIAAAEVVVFPFLRRYGSASGIFHKVLAAGKPVACAPVPTFAEATDGWGAEFPELFPPPGDVEAWSRAMITLLSEEPIRRRVGEAAAALGRETSWSSVARRHLQLYRSLLPRAPRAGQGSGGENQPAGGG